MPNRYRPIILGGGMTGLAAGFASDLPVYEAAAEPGGICSSYFVLPGDSTRRAKPPNDHEAYRFELGGGHWIFGGDPAVLHLIDRLSPMKTYYRTSSVFFQENGQYVPYPLQNNLRCLDSPTVARALTEILATPGGPATTMADWLQTYFGKTLCDLFFFPFHDLYTAQLFHRIAPQDAYKSPVSARQVIQGAWTQSQQVGYNVSYLYPEHGLSHLASRLAERCTIHYGMKAVRIDPAQREVAFDNGQTVPFSHLVSTLPLNQTLDMAGLSVPSKADPHTSVLVLNIGAARGPACPDDHWLYVCNTKNQFHRVGFYSNVTDSFLPASCRGRNSHVSIYVERAYIGGERPTAAEVAAYGQAVAKELQDWQFIGTVDVLDPTWIDVAYTWNWPNSKWVQEATDALQRHDIYAVGRYARWHFQGIADSIRDGFIAGASFRTT